MHFQLKSLFLFLFYGTIDLPKTFAEDTTSSVPYTTAPVTFAPFTSPSQPINNIVPLTASPITSAPITSAPITTSAVTDIPVFVASSFSPSEFSPKSDYRCGVTEYDSRTNCGKLCTFNSDCNNGEFCWGTFPNKCYVSNLSMNNPEADFESVTPESPSKPTTMVMPSSVPANFIPNPTTPTSSTTSPLKSDFRCGINEEDSRTNCGKVCIFQSDCNSGEYCWSTFPNTCYISVRQAGSPTAPRESIASLPFTASPLTIAPVTLGPIASAPTITSSPVTTTAPITTAPFITSAPVVPSPAAVAPFSLVSTFPPKSDFRCGINEEDSRTNCGKLCIFISDCDSDNGEYCWSTFPNKCYANNLPVAPSQVDPFPTDVEPKSDLRCGTSEADARANCKKECGTKVDCKSDEYCFATLPNYCHAKLEGAI